jgi:hypothetical protein
MSQEQSPSSKSARVQSLDDAFLFSIGSTNIVLTLFPIVLSRQDVVLFSMPVLIAGLFFPFYIGYLRGAIVVDTILERIRGWIYLTTGMSIYAAGLAVILLRYSRDLSLILYLVFYAVGFVLSRNWLRSIVRATQSPLSNKDLVVVGGTVGATIALVFVLFISEEFVRLYMDVAYTLRPQDLIIDVGSAAFVLLIFLIIERTARAVSSSSQEIDTSCNVNSIRGAAGQVMLSSQGCLLKGAWSDKKALYSAFVSLAAYTVLLVLSLALNDFHPMIAIGIGLVWVVAYLFSLYRYIRVPMQVPQTREIFIH